MYSRCSYPHQTGVRLEVVKLMSEKHERNLDRLRLYLKVLSIGGTYRHVTERAPTAKLGGDRWILNFSGRSCAWKARYIDLDQHMAFFVLLDRGIYASHVRGGALLALRGRSRQ